MENKTYDLRNQYNFANLEALRLMGVRETDRVNRALYGVYCEALHAVKEAIEQGAQIGDLEKAINDIRASESRIVEE